MYCPQCGIQVLPEHVYCGKCGYRLAGAGTTPVADPRPAVSTDPGAAARSRVSRHLSVLGILWIVFSMLRLIPGLALLVFSRAHFPFFLAPIPPPVRAFLLPFLGIVGFAVTAIGVAGVIAGWGLLTYQHWARVLALVVAFISLIHFPLGTALGIYTIWVLFPREAEREYLRLAASH